MGFNYWALIASTWCINKYSIKKSISLGRQVIHIHDYDMDGEELSITGLHKDNFMMRDGKLPFIDDVYFSPNNLRLDSLDYSDYENATFVSDLVQTPEKFLECGVNQDYDAVFDIGTTEHVGNPFNAVKNAFSLLRPGGYYIYDLPYCSWNDHGLFQFNPSFFTHLCRQNDLKMEFQFLHPTCRNGHLIFIRDNAPIQPSCITSIFGCIKKPLNYSLNQLDLTPPSQTFTKYADCPANINNLIAQNSNIPVVNILEPHQLLPYLDGKLTFECFWLKFNEMMKIGGINIYNPSSDCQNDKITFF